MTYNYNLDQEDIDKLLEEIQSLSLPSITKIKPFEIIRMQDKEEREKLIENFSLVDFLYVKPLENLLKYITVKNGQTFYRDTFENDSILDRTLILKDRLFRLGYSEEQVMSMLPKTTTETEIILMAKKKGYNDTLVLDNVHRVEACQEYLNSLENNQESGRRSA